MPELDMLNNLSIREYTDSDLPQVLDLNRRVVEESGNLEYQDPDQLVTDFLDSEGGKILIVEDPTSNQIIGMQGYKSSKVQAFEEDEKQVLKLNLLLVN